jgi:hypothetical protein
MIRAEPATLGTLDLQERPGQRVRWFWHVKHFQEDQRVDLAPGEAIFSSGPHHTFYSYTIESSEAPATSRTHAGDA